MILEACVAVVSLVLLYITVVYAIHLSNVRKCPPGPFPLPVIGNLNLLSGKKAHEALRDLSLKYGDVYSVSLGMVRVVVVNSIQPAREALLTRGTDFAGRPNESYSTDLITRSYQDISMTDFSPLFSYLRKLGHSALKMYGDGRGSLEEMVVVESDALHERIRKSGGETVDVHLEFGELDLLSYCKFSHT